MLAVLLIGLALASAMLHLILPAARPMLVEACRGTLRARFWIRFTALALLLSIPAGVLFAFVNSNRVFPSEGPRAEDSAFATQVAMVRTGWVLGASVVVSLAAGVAASTSTDKFDVDEWDDWD